MSFRSRIFNVVIYGSVLFAALTLSIANANAQSNAPKISLQNLDGVPFSDRLVFSRIGSSGAAPNGNVVHDTASLRVKNIGTASLDISALPVSGSFTLVNAPQLPISIASGGQLDLTVRFIATCCNVNNGTLTIMSNDPAQPNAVVELSGAWQSIPEGGVEPSLANIIKVFGYTTSIASPTQQLNKAGLIQASGDEVLSPYWQRAISTQPVTVRELAAYQTQGRVRTISYFAKGSSTLTTILSNVGSNSQTILPQTNPSSGSFTPPSTTFGFNVTGESSDPTKNTTTYDVQNGCAGPCGHHLRFWPAYDRQGVLIPYAWLMVMDFSGATGNYDYQDHVYLISNIKPENPLLDPSVAPRPGSPSLILDFTHSFSSSSSLTDKDGEFIGFLFTQPNKLDVGTSPGSNSYQPSLIDLNTSQGTLNITTSGTSTTGSNSGNDNTLVNGLQTRFDASTGKFTISARLKGPLKMISAGNQQGGVMFGPDQDNFVKMIADNKNGQLAVDFFSEQGGSGANVGGSNTSVAIANAATISSLELMLECDAETGVIRGGYRAVYPTQDTGVVMLANALTIATPLRNKYFTRGAKGGLITTNKGASAITLEFERFAVEGGDVTGGVDERSVLYRLDVGATSNYTDTQGHTWSPDTGLFSPTSAAAEGADVQPQEIENTDDDVIYRTYRGNVGNVPQSERVLTYNIPVRGLVDLRLHFAERYAPNGDFGKRLFDIEAEGQTLRQSFDIYGESGGLNTAVVLPLNGINVTDGSLTLVLRASVNYVSIAGIEVLCHSGTCTTNTETLTLPPTADAYMRDTTYAATNFGGDTALNVKLNSTSGNNRQSYLKFDLSGVSGVVNAKLRLYGRLTDTTGTNVPVAAYSVSDASWSESGITWNNKPVLGGTALTTATVTDTTARWYEFDVTSYVQGQVNAGQSSISLALKGAAASLPYASFNSRESGTNAPQLVIIH